jgi:hypothetical protein
MLQSSGPFVFLEQLSFVISFLFLHQFQDPGVLVIIQPKAMLIGAQIHFQIVKPVLESLEESATFGAFRRCRRGIAPASNSSSPMTTYRNRCVYRL